ncbi:MAG: hypothetical protein ABSC55_25030, partial [Syntrophorhabdales bacterium]
MKMRHFLLQEAYAILQALWYSLAGLSIFSGRALSVAAGLLFLLMIDRCLLVAGISTTVRYLAVAIGGINYFYIYAASLIRPEVFSLSCTATALFLYLTWQQKPTSLYRLFWAHVFMILAALFHLQAAFTAMMFWLAMLLFNRRDITIRHIIAISLPYA